MISQDISEKQAKIVYLGLGSNLGNRLINLEKTKIELLNNGIKIIKSSSYYESLSWPNPRDPKFFNSILKIETSFDMFELLNVCKKTEKFLGRKKTKKNAPRNCDIDIIDYDQKIIRKDINLPHPRMHKRNFVLFPLYEVDKEWIHPISKHHIKSLIFALPSRDISSIKQI